MNLQSNLASNNHR